MDAKKLKALSELIPDSIALPGSELYEKASQFFKRTLAPNIVVRPTSSEEMAVIIHFINENKLPFAIKSGGHSNIVYDLADDIILIDLAALAEVEIADKEKGLIRVGSGALAGKVANKLDQHGLALASGDSRVVGIGGLATGGGLGFLVRKYGALVDDVVSLEVVTADGTIVEANKNANDDLFWAIRGSGSNFGIVTHLTIQAHPVTNVFEVTVSYPLENTATIIKGWRNTMRNAPAEFTSILTVLPSKADTPGSVLIHGCVIGADETIAKEIVAPLLIIGKPNRYSLEPMRYKDILEDMSFRATARYSIARNAFLKTFTDEAIDTIARLSDQGTLPVLQIRHVAGVMNQRPLAMTAFSHRDSEVLVYYSTSVDFNATEKEIHASLEAWRILEPLGSGCYINMSSLATKTEVARAFPPEVLKRLEKIKKQYDPANIFSANYNIPPVQ